MRLLEETGTIEGNRASSATGAIRYEMTQAGQELLAVLAGLAHWLAEGPGGGTELGASQARIAVKGLVDSWASSVLTGLADKPRTLTELDKQTVTAGYPTIERCLETLRLADQIEAGARSKRGHPYSLTTWMRRGIAPLALAARWEHVHRPSTTAEPVARADIEGAIAVAAPLVALPPTMSGFCQFAVRIDGKPKKPSFLASIEVDGGKLSVGSIYPERKPDARASSTIVGWFSILIDATKEGLRVRGDRDLVEEIIRCLHQDLFGALKSPAPRHFSNKTDY